MPPGVWRQSLPEQSLGVRDLSIDLVRAPNIYLPVVTGASFEIPPGSIVGLFGESGCGKTTLALALMGLLPPRKYRVTGSALWEGRNLFERNEREWEAVRGAGIAMLCQDSLLALNPVLRVREQLSEALRAHGLARKSVEAPLALAGLDPSRRILDAYPHQISGGERQRVAIALALACEPRLVIADEPFTALDAPRALELSDSFRSMRDELGISFLLIGHDPAALARVADYSLVMYGGSIVERGDPREVLRAPLHPYAAALLRALPDLSRPGEARPVPIPGNPPGLEERAAGCGFAPRCAERLERCAAEAPPEVLVGERGRVRCFRYGG